MTDKKLEYWLKQQNKHAVSVYKDPGYSNFYKSYFGSYVDESFYPKNDIDVKLDPIYVESLFIDDNDELQQFVDYIPQHVSQDIIDVYTHKKYGDDKRDIIDKLERKCLLILPGSNQSNANFVYKLLLNTIVDIDSFSIPYVSNNINEQYTGELKEAYMDIDKMDLYKFIHKNSIKM